MIKPVINYIKEVRTELKKVEWPGKEEVKNYTYVVVAFSIAIGLFITTSDFIFKKLLEIIINLS